MSKVAITVFIAVSVRYSISGGTIYTLCEERKSIRNHSGMVADEAAFLEIMVRVVENSVRVRATEAE